MPRTRQDKHQTVCAREDCGKQFFQRRVGQEFCSQDCSNKAFPGTGGKKPTAGLGLRICANESCGKQFQPYRANNFTCSHYCYTQLPNVKERYNAARRTPEHREHKNEWRRTDPAQRARAYNYNRKRSLARLGLTVEDYDRMLAEQDGRCMLCGRTAKPDGIKAEAKLHADHDHATGQPRDLLCSNCNKGLGCFGDDPVLLRTAADYIERHRRVHEQPTQAEDA